MGFIDGFLDKMKLGGNYDDDEEYDEYDDAPNPEEAFHLPGRPSRRKIICRISGRRRPRSPQSRRVSRDEAPQKRQEAEW